MNTRKRPASDSLLPLRAPKHPRTAWDHPDGGNASPSQFEGILSRWITLAKDACRLSRETVLHIIQEFGPKHVEDAEFNPSPLPSGSTENLSPRIRGVQKSNQSSPSPPPSHIDNQTTPEIDINSTTTTSSLPEDRIIFPEKLRRSRGPPPSSPVRRTDTRMLNSVFPSSKLTTPKSINSSLDPSEKPSQMDQAPGSSGHHKNIDAPALHGTSQIPPQPQGSMGPPLSFPPRHSQRSRMDRNVMTPPSTSTMSTSSLSLSDIRNGLPEIGEILAESMRKSHFPDGMPRKYQNREHIFAKSHKTGVLAARKKDREDMIRELFRLRRNTGYISDFETFQNWLDYGARLDQLDKRGALSPSPSLIDLRSRAVTPTANRRHSVPEDLNSDFLERSLEKARQALNGPKPPKPYIPSLDRLWQSTRAKDQAIERRLRLPLSLPLEDEEKVDALLRKRGIVSKNAREQVTDKDISRLKPHQWLNDEIINFYGSMILGRSEECKENPGVGIGGGKKKPLNVHYFSTFFWPKLTGEGYDKARLAKWTKKFDLFQKDIVLIPVNHHNSHWTGAAINFRRKRIESYDSMGVDRPNVYKLLRSYIDSEHRNKKKKPFDFSDWEDYTLEDTPQQENGYDCGVFTCQFLESLSRGEESFNFTQSNMPYLRRRMIWEIGNVSLRDDP